MCLNFVFTSADLKLNSARDFNYNCFGSNGPTLFSTNDKFNQQVRRGDPIEEDEYIRTCTKCSFRRTMRDVSLVGEEGVKFDTYSNDMWAVRHAALSKFQQAARKIIIRRRAQIKLRSLRDAMIDWGKPKTTKSASRKYKLYDFQIKYN